MTPIGTEENGWTISKTSERDNQALSLVAERRHLKVGNY